MSKTPENHDGIRDIRHIGDLTPDPHNPRLHNPRNIGMIAQSLQEIGAARSIVIDENGVVLAGNGVLDGAAEAGIEHVQVVDADGDTIIAVRRSGLTDYQKHRLKILDNRTAELADWNPPVLDEYRGEGYLDDLFYDEELDSILQTYAQDDEGTAGGAGGDDFDPTPDNVAPPKVAKGDIWQIGRHRLMCADAYDRASIDALLDGQKPTLLHTDPPYGTNTVQPRDVSSGHDPLGIAGPKGTPSPTGDTGSVGGSKPFGSAQRGGPSRTEIIHVNMYPLIEGDDRPFDPRPFLEMNLAPVSIFWGANYYADKLPISSSWICWDKREGMTRNNFADCELAWSSKGGPARIFYHLWNGLVKGSQHNERRTHPTEKPIALYQEIGNLYSPGGIWLDLFGGTGAIIVAAERSGATALVCEIEPLYCDVILRRAEAEGIKPIEKCQHTT